MDRGTAGIGSGQATPKRCCSSGPTIPLQPEGVRSTQQPQSSRHPQGLLGPQPAGWTPGQETERRAPPAGSTWNKGRVTQEGSNSGHQARQSGSGHLCFQPLPFRWPSSSPPPPCPKVGIWTSRQEGPPHSPSSTQGGDEGWGGGLFPLQGWQSPGHHPKAKGSFSFLSSHCPPMNPRPGEGQTRGVHNAAHAVGEI